MWIVLGVVVVLAAFVAGMALSARLRDRYYEEQVVKERDAALVKLANIESIAGRPDLGIEDAVQSLANEADDALAQVFGDLDPDPDKRVLHVVVPLLVRERELARGQKRPADDDRLRRALNALMDDVEPGAEAKTLSTPMRAEQPTLPGDP